MISPIVRCDYTDYFLRDFCTDIDNINLIFDFIRFQIVTPIKTHNLSVIVLTDYKIIN